MEIKSQKVTLSVMQKKMVLTSQDLAEFNSCHEQMIIFLFGCLSLSANLTKNNGWIDGYSNIRTYVGFTTQSCSAERPCLCSPHPHSQWLLRTQKLFNSLELKKKK